MITEAYETNTLGHMNVSQKKTGHKSVYNMTQSQMTISIKNIQYGKIEQIIQITTNFQAFNMIII